ncbi:DUF2524 family protein [Alkalihalobacillus sp. MEB130]|uniref:DUF2524 family protein n=1 Tax=Alkalihalobacillus sp. MEB130 TaxID=2976704 RepID=UPI0028DE1D69|nr:DUF2524 family protein [Alkalihalobacillus sp. MEB130]MDT8860675.1 DUF2524 family protein [Alkalihalobacillus sp. MEB130]
MATEQSIEECLYRVQDVIDRALTELMEVKIIRENDPTEFAFVQKELSDLQIELDSFIDEESNNTRLIEAQQRLNEVREIMTRGI